MLLHIKIYTFILFENKKVVELGKCSQETSLDCTRRYKEGKEMLEIFPKDRESKKENAKETDSGNRPLQVSGSSSETQHPQFLLT